MRMAAKAAAAAAPAQQAQHAAVAAPAAAQQIQDAAAAAAATPVQIAMQTAAALARTPPPQATTHLQLSRAEPFSLGAQWAAYTNPSPNMPGYPPGYWQSEPSPFAVLASQTLWGHEAAGRAPAGPPSGSSAGVNNAAGLGCAAVH